MTEEECKNQARIMEKQQSSSHTKSLTVAKLEQQKVETAEWYKKQSQFVRDVLDPLQRKLKKVEEDLLQTLDYAATRDEVKLQNQIAVVSASENGVQDSRHVLSLEMRRAVVPTQESVRIIHANLDACAAIGTDVTYSLGEVRILIMGSCFHGKSATANTILGTQRFTLSDASSGKPCQLSELGVETYKGTRLKVVETHGVCGISHRARADIEAGVPTSLNLLAPGPHAVLWTVAAAWGYWEYSADEHDQFLATSRLLPRSALDRLVVVFTCGDQCTPYELRQKLCSNAWLQALVSEAGGRYLLFNNNTCDEEQRQVQVDQLMDIIAEMNGWA